MPQECPPVPASEDPRDLGFTRRPMVRWYDPRQLARTGVSTLLSTLFGAYADKREILATREATAWDYSDRDELWIDYVADLGDGFDSTHTLARLLAQPQLRLPGLDQPLERGRILVFGGDEVYPAATRQQYTDRLVGPYRAALPWVPTAQAPHLFAVPGNHDWYDGLTAFNRLFCQRRWLGGWRTRQRRSYFALKLPHRWWLWGVDIQLQSEIDDPQKEYFHQVARGEAPIEEEDAAEHPGSTADAMRPGDGVLLCTAEPSWIYAETEEGDGHSNLDYLQRTVVRHHGGVLKAALAGDLHHYARFESAEDGSQRITAGGGGAFLHETHNLPHTLRLEVQETDAPSHTATFERRRIFPESRTSRWLMLRNLLFPLLNWDFSIFLGLFYLFYSWIVESASKRNEGSFLFDVWGDFPSPAGAPRFLGKLLTVLAHSPASVVLTLGLIFGFIGFVEPDLRARPWVQQLQRWGLGLVHGLAHLTAILVLFWTAGWVNHALWGFENPTLPGQVTAFVLEVGLVGGLLGGVVMGLYLMLANLLFRCHSNAASSAFKVADYKNFLRLHITREGVTIYPIGVRKVNRQWQLHRGAPRGSHWFLPEDGTIAALAHLIEPPIHLPAPPPAALPAPAQPKAKRKAAPSRPRKRQRSKTAGEG